MSNNNITNMHHYFNLGYYDFLDKPKDLNEILADVDRDYQTIFNEKHQAITKYDYSEIKTTWLEDVSSHVLEGTVQYPGLIMGVGNAHSLGTKGEIVMGFSFDYVTGLPYLPGSSLKGILKDKFQYGEYILDLLKNINGLKVDLPTDEIEKEFYISNVVKAIIQDMFGDEYAPGKDIFMDSYVQLHDNSKEMLKMDYLAPHKQDKDAKSLFEVNILTMLRVAPKTKIKLNFILRQSNITVKTKEGNVILSDYAFSPEHKLELFKQILTDFGIGAKTNVGYGNLVFK